MDKKLILLVVCLVLTGHKSWAKPKIGWLPKLLGTFHVKDAAFVEVFEVNPEAENVEDKYNLYVTTFNALALFIHDPVYRIRTPGKFLDDVSSWGNKLEKMGGANTAYWPNYPISMPKEIAGFTSVVQTSGFLVPGKKYGQLEIYNEDNGMGPWNIAALDSQDYSYHWVEFFDVDGDGLEDVFTARFHVNFIGQTSSELLWMKNPGNLGANGNGWSGWEQHVLVEDGPDVFFTFDTKTLNGVEYSVLTTAELWTERVMLYYVEAGTGAWSDKANIKSTVIDGAAGVCFEARAADVNADGRQEILASCITDNLGSLYAYTLASDDLDWTDGSNWEKRIIATDFEPAGSLINPNMMSPGKSRTFYPTKEYEALTNEDGSPLKPWISLSGDDDGHHYILYPQTEDKSDWNYDLETIIDTGADTSGTMAIVDLDGDGNMELISAGYSAGTVYVHTFAQD